jgi:hypothetical protein
MTSTHDVGFGTMWTKLVGELARWEPGEDREVAALGVVPGDPPRVGMGLVSVWVAGDGPVLVCDGTKGVRALRGLHGPLEPERVRAALRESGAVEAESAAVRYDPAG